jgi:hypothetical protein
MILLFSEHYLYWKTVLNSSPCILISKHCAQRYLKSCIVNMWNVNWSLDYFTVLKVKVKDSRNRPGVAQRVPGGLGSQISRHSAREGGEVSLTHWPSLPPGMFLVLIFTRG